MKKFPACLPITNDYLPSQQRLIREYLEASYKLIPDSYDFLEYGQCHRFGNLWNITFATLFSVNYPML